jgi:hypothetical protein
MLSDRGTKNGEVQIAIAGYRTHVVRQSGHTAPACVTRRKLVLPAVSATVHALHARHNA